MEFEQIVKQLEWLDEEFRKNKLILNAFEEKTSKIDYPSPEKIKRNSELMLKRVVSFHPGVLAKSSKICPSSKRSEMIT